jgi:FlaA1/EpsC-like NDP-sugar epimerase
MVERCENALYEIDREMRSRRLSTELLPLMVDVNDRSKMDGILAAESPSVVLHAAAYKHVPMVELNPEEGWRNNTEATRQLAELSAARGVGRFVLISTDKAVNPVSVMGKTKLAAERAVMAMNSNASATSFCAVRFGNVFGSSGSVVPLFRELIAKGGPVTVTHPDMKRYFMTVQEAVSLVLQAASRSERAIYTLDMGSPVKILDLAENMISSRGLRPYIDIPIVFTGIRPGEKIFEEIDVSEKSAYKTDMAKIYITKLPGRD